MLLRFKNVSLSLLRKHINSVLVFFSDQTQTQFCAYELSYLGQMDLIFPSRLIFWEMVYCAENRLSFPRTAGIFQRLLAAMNSGSIGICPL
jgi:hypothetical protein